MTQGRPSFRRRQYFVKKDFQSEFIIKFCLLVLAGIIISTGLLLILSQGTLTSTFQNSRLVIQNTALAILPAALLTNLITLALIILATIFVVLFISHKIAGPLYRFEKELKRISEGDLSQEIRLRKKDQITDIAKGLNLMTSSFREKLIHIRADLEKLRDEAVKNNAPQEIIKGLNDLFEKIESTFKI